MASAAVFKKPSVGSQMYLCGELEEEPPHGTDADKVAYNSGKLLGEIERLFNDEDGGSFGISDVRTVRHQKFFGFTVGRFGCSDKLARRHTFQTLSPSSEWFKLSPKSKLRKRLKRSSRFQRNRSDTFLLHEGLCTLRRLPQLCSPEQKRRSSIRTPVDNVQRQLFTPDSGYSSSIEHLEDVFDSTPRLPKRHVIGRYVDCGELDIVGELSREVPELIERILKHLTDNDLLSFAQVSCAWNSALVSNKKSDRRRSSYLRRKRIAYSAKKENINGGAVRPSARTLTQTSALFGDIQPLVDVTPQRRKNQLSSHPGQSSRHADLWQSQDTLRVGDVRVKCLCGSPATVDSAASRARCGNCRFDFCTNCKGSYHGNKPCRTPSRVRGDGVLTPKSRRNLRRL